MDGGYNLYGMVGNDPVGRWDWLGGWPGPGAYNPYIHNSYRYENKYKEPPKTGTNGAAKDWTYEGLRKRFQKEKGKSRFLIPHREFWKMLPDTVKKQYCAYRVYTFGCKGVAALLAGRYKYSPSEIGFFGKKPGKLTFYNLGMRCYDTYQHADKFRRSLCCSNGGYPAIIAIGVTECPSKDFKPDDDDGKYPSDIYRGMEIVGSNGQYDYGFVLKDGAVIHAEGQFEQGDKNVVVSKDVSDYEADGWFYVYCVFCAK